MLVLLHQNLSSSLTFLFTIFCLYQEILFSMKWYMFPVKNWTNFPVVKFMEESCPATFYNCFGVKDSWFKSVVISSKSLVIFSCGTVKVNSLVSTTVPNHFPFVLGLKSLFLLLLITNPAERRSFLTTSLTYLVISKPRHAAMPSSIQIMALILLPLHRFVKGRRTFVKT